MPTLAYLYLGDDFASASTRTGLVVNIVYTNGFKQDVTSLISWGTLNADGTVSGSIVIDGEEKTAIKLIVKAM